MLPVMTEPTKNDYVKLADIFGVSLDHCQEVRLYGNDVFTVYCALRLAANLPSEEEIHNLMAETISEDQPLFKTAARILERIGSVK